MKDSDRKRIVRLVGEGHQISKVWRENFPQYSYDDVYWTAYGEGERSARGTQVMISTRPADLESASKAERKAPTEDIGNPVWQQYRTITSNTGPRGRRAGRRRRPLRSPRRRAGPVHHVDHPPPAGPPAPIRFTAEPRNPTRSAQSAANHEFFCSLLATIHCEVYKLPVIVRGWAAFFAVTSRLYSALKTSVLMVQDPDLLTLIFAPARTLQLAQLAFARLADLALECCLPLWAQLKQDSSWLWFVSQSKKSLRETVTTGSLQSNTSVEFPGVASWARAGCPSSNRRLAASMC